MSNVPPIHPGGSPADDSLNFERQLVIDRLCDRYEQQFREGDAPSLREFINSHCQEWEIQETRHFVRELIALDRELRRDSGLPQSDYASELPEHQAAVNDGVALDEQSQASTGDSSVAGKPVHVVMVSDDGGSGSAASPKQLGPYRILRILGQGGMGVVYEAEHVEMGQRVALKTLQAGRFPDRRALQRFKNEAYAVSRLDHPNIVPVTVLDSDQGIHFYVMKYVEGANLAEVIERMRADAKHAGPADSEPDRLAETEGVATDERVESHAAGSVALSASSTHRSVQAIVSTARSTDMRGFFRNFAELGAAVAEALHHAHERDVIHRDIKPSNLLLDHEGKIWVADFGLAQVEDTPSFTQTGDFVGTLRYMSPEQALAKRVAVDRRTDIYSLGVTLYELLTLRIAFDGQGRQEVLHQIAFKDPTLPRKLDPRIPKDLETIVRKAMAKSPDDRFQTSGELAAELRRWLEGDPIKSSPPSLLKRAAIWARRHKPLVATAAVVATLLLALTSTFSFVLAAAYNDEHQQRLQVERLLKRSEANRLATMAMLRMAEGRGPGEAAVLAAKAVQLDASATTTNALRRAIGANHELLTLPLNAKWIETLSVDPQGRYAVTGARPDVTPKPFEVWELASGKRRAELKSNASLSSAVFSPKGVRILTSSQIVKPSEDPSASAIRTPGPVEIWDSLTGNRLAELPEARLNDLQNLGRLSFSPDGAEIVCPAAENTAVVYDAIDGGTRVVLQGHTAPVKLAAFSPSGDSIVTVGEDGSLIFWNRQGKLQHRIDKAWQSRPATHLIFRDDGRLLCTRSPEGIDLWNLETFARRNDRNWLGESVAFSADGAVLFVGRKYRRSLHAYSSDTGAELWSVDQLPGHVYSLHAPTTAADTQAQATVAVATGDRIELRQVWTGERIATLLGHDATVMQLRWLNDRSSRLLSVALDGTARLWRSESGAALDAFEGRPTVHPDLLIAQTEQHLALAAGIREQVHVLTAEENQLSPQATWLGETADVESGIALVLDRNQAAIWKVGDAQPTTNWDPNAGELSEGRLSPNGSIALLISREGRGWIWHWRERRIIALPKSTIELTDAAISTDGSEAGLAFADGTIRRLDLNTGELRREWSVQRRCLSIRYSADDQRVAVAAAGNVAYIFSIVEPDQRPQIIKDASAPFDQIEFTADGKYVLLWNRLDNKAVRYLSFPEGELQPNSAPLQGRITVQRSRDGRRFLAAGKPGVVLGGLEQPPRTLFAGEATEACFLNQETQAVCVANRARPRHLGKLSDRKQLLLFDLETGQQLGQHALSSASHVDLRGADALEETGGGSLVLFTGRRLAIELFADSADSNPTATIQGHGGNVSWMQFLSGDSRLATAALDGTAAMWDVETGELIRWFEGHGDAIFAAALNPDATRLATGDMSGELRIWRVNTGNVAGRFDVGAAVRFLAYDQRSQLWVTRNSLGELALWSEDGEVTAPWGEQRFRFVRVGSKGGLLACPVEGRWPPPQNPATKYKRLPLGMPDGAKVLHWRTQVKQEGPLLLRHEAAVIHASLDRDQSRCVSVDYEGNVFLWRLEGEQATLQFTLAAEKQPAVAAEFDPKGNHLLVQRASHATLHSAEDGRLLGNLPIANRVTDYREQRFSPDGRWIYDVDRDRQRVRRFAVDIQRYAEGQLPREWTDADDQHYGVSD